MTEGVEMWHTYLIIYGTQKKLGQFDSLDESSFCYKKIPTLMSQIDSVFSSVQAR